VWWAAGNAGVFFAQVTAEMLIRPQGRKNLSKTFFWVNKGFFLIKFAPPKPLFFKFASPKPL
jgi:hypothetical protein